MNNKDDEKGQQPDNLLNFKPKSGGKPPSDPPYELKLRLRLHQAAWDVTGTVTPCMMECAIRLLFTHEVKL